MRPLLVIVCVLSLVPVAFGRSKTIKATPEVPQGIGKPVASAITLNVRQASSGRTAGGTSTTASGGVRSTTVHSVGIEVTVANLGTQPEDVTIRWFWVGRYETSRNWFRVGDGEKTMMVEPTKTAPPFLATGEIEEHHTKSASSQYKSGGHLAGWVVTAHNSKGELVAIKTSDSYLDGFATQPPPKKRR